MEKDGIMKEIIEYRIITGTGDEELQEAINQAIKDGWQPYGELQTPTSIIWTKFTQVVVKYKYPEQNQSTYIPKTSHR